MPPLSSYFPHSHILLLNQLTSLFPISQATVMETAKQLLQGHALKEQNQVYTLSLTQQQAPPHTRPFINWTVSPYPGMSHPSGSHVKSSVLGRGDKQNRSRS